MERKFTPDFIPEVINQKLFETDPARNIFKEWCQANDSILPIFVTRKVWEQNNDLDHILSDKSQGQQILYLPEDLHLPEVVDIVNIINRDTYNESPEKIQNSANRIAKLGETFVNAGRYLNSYLPDLDKGKDIADTIAQQFYYYGFLLCQQSPNPTGLKEEDVLTDTQKQEIDRWFLGQDMYHLHLNRLGPAFTPKELEEHRKKYLKAYFNTLSKPGYLWKHPWETATGPAYELQETTKTKIIQAINAPQSELDMAIFNRGAQKLVKDIKIASAKAEVEHFLNQLLGTDLSIEKKRLYQKLKIPTLKRQLENVKDTGNIDEISDLELKTAQKILSAVCNFPHSFSLDRKADSSCPARILDTQIVNCVGSTILGGGLLKETGILYLQASTHNHSATALITSDKKIYWQDFSLSAKHPENYKKIDLNPENKRRLDAFISNPDNPDVDINFQTDFSTGRYQHVFLSHPERGAPAQVLNNIGNIRLKTNQDQEAKEAYIHSIQLDPKPYYSYLGLAASLYKLEKYSEAAQVYIKSLSLHTFPEVSYTGLALSLYADKSAYMAGYALVKALKANPKYEMAIDTIRLFFPGPETEQLLEKLGSIEPKKENNP